MKQKIINELTKYIDLSVDDLRKVLMVQYPDGISPNFIGAMICMAITEPIAKITFWDLMVPAKKKKIKKLDAIDAKLAFKKFSRKYMQNKLYYKLAQFIWDTFRNGHIHLYTPKKIINVKKKLETTSGISWDRDNVYDLHLQWHLKDGVWIFCFSPHQYYLDLVEALKQFKKDLNKTRGLKKIYEFIEEARIIDISKSKKITLQERKFIRKMLIESIVKRREN